MKLETRKIPESEPEMVEIRYHWITDEIQEIISFVKSRQGQLSAVRDGKRFEVPVVDLFYAESVDDRLFLYTASDSYEIRMWEFAGNFDANGVLYYDNCVSTLFEFDEQGNETPIILFSGGSGKLEYNASNGGILWTSDNDLDVFDFSKT